MKDKIFPPGTALNDIMNSIKNADSKNRMNGPRAQETRLKLLQLSDQEKLLAALTDMSEVWGTELENKGVIQDNDCSRLHKLNEAINSRRVPSIDPEEGIKIIPSLKDFRTFVISRNWADLVKEDAYSEFRLPFDQCAFEIRLSGRTVIVICEQKEFAAPNMNVFFEANNGLWVEITAVGVELWIKIIWATCIMLEAEVIEHTVIRAPHKLNQKRILSGKLPMYDFHTLSLAKRFRTSKGAPGNATGAHKRLHFVRGHWRHYEEHKTWIKWHLRGDETLGFADKNYKV